MNVRISMILLLMVAVLMMGAHLKRNEPLPIDQCELVDVANYRATVAEMTAGWWVHELIECEDQRDLAQIDLYDCLDGDPDGMVRHPWGCWHTNEEGVVVDCTPEEQAEWAMPVPAREGEVP